MGLTRKQWMMLVVIVCGSFITILNQTLVTPALPAIMDEMSVDAATGQWLTSGFTLMNAIMIPITAYLQDRFSIRGLFLFSMGLFAVGTLMCAWGPNFGVLLGGRLVQAAGAGILMPMSMTVLLITFPIERRGSAMGIFGLIIAFAPAIGPTISGIMVDVASWHIMFYVITGLSAVVIVLAAFLIDSKMREDEAKASLDIPSVILSTLGFGGMLYGFSAIGSQGFDAVTIITTIVGTVCVVLFFIRQNKLEVPMLRVRILLNRNFLVATIICMLVQASLLVAPVLMPIYVQNLLGFPATVSGLVIMPGAILMGIMNPIAGKIFDRYGPRAMGIIGMVLLCLTTLVFGFVQLDTNIIFLTVVFAIRMLAMALVNMPITTWGMNSLDTKLMNHGTSINNTLRMVAGSLGTALVVSVYSLVGAYAAPTFGELQGSMYAFNISFMVCTALVLIGLVLTIIFVKGAPGTMEATGKEAEGEVVPSEHNRLLLTKIMKRDVYVLRADSTVKDAMELFIDEGISACPIIDDDGEPVGFISDGDILKTLARSSKSYLDPVALIASSIQDNREYADKLDHMMDLPVTSIGVHNLISVNVNADIDEVCRVLAEHHLKKVPVMDGGKIVGIINRSDITRYSMEAYLEGRPEDATYCDDDDGTEACEPADDGVSTSGSASVAEGASAGGSAPAANEQR